MTNSATPLFLEDHISQIPALQLLQNLGWEYLTPEEALKLRGGRASRVLLTGILSRKLSEINSIRYKGETHPFSEANIRTAIEALEDVLIDGLVHTSEKIYDMLRLPKAMQQTIAGDTRSFNLWYIDWMNPKNDAFHVTEEFSVERTGSKDTCRPDIVLFVNGIPIGVIECKRPDEQKPIDQAISQHIRNQKNEYIPRLFLYTQILLVTSKNEVRYGTTGTPKPFWAVWREDLDEELIREAVNSPLLDPQKDQLFAGRFHYVRRHFDALDATGREVTEQDRTLYALCRPERLLDLLHRYILYDGAEKKIARYQQYFCVRRAMERFSILNADGKRTGGVVWHTQGSGKSLTMVMLATAIAEDIEGRGKKLVLVTDRIDLDDQISGTFRRCGLQPQRARTGKHLVQLLMDEKVPVVTTVIDKFETASSAKGLKLESPNIFVLVDESHRGQYGIIHAKMRKVMPNACFVGFTGTPVMKAQKNTIRQFGGLIDDPYTIHRAVEDQTVVELLYEGRHAPQIVDKQQVDRWFERITANLSKRQAADLKRKFSSTAQLDSAEQKVAAIAWDISTHFADTWSGTGFKGQLVARKKSTALLYKKHMEECGLVSSAVLISAPDDREGEIDVLEENTEEEVRFWRQMMEKYGTEAEYNRQLISGFKYGPEPEIIIVVEKLLTGFDAPRNVVLYLTRPLKDHSLLQAIARVNRIHEGKDFGYVIDYAGVLQSLDHALDLYGNLSNFDAGDLDGTLTDVSKEIGMLLQRHADLWDLFKKVRHSRDQEAYERVLADAQLREEFYKRLSIFARTLQLALSTATFLDKVSDAKIRNYRGDLKFFMALRRSARHRYAEEVDFGDYEPRIQRLLDRYVGTGQVETLTDLVEIFDQEKFAQEIERLTNSVSKADTIAYRTEKVIRERWEEDPAYYRRFSDLLEDAIKAFREQRLSDAEYLRRVREISEDVRDRKGDTVPEAVRYNGDARAMYGVVRETLTPYETAQASLEPVAAAAALDIERLIDRLSVVDWVQNSDVQNQMRNVIEDRLFELVDRDKIGLTLEDIDDIIERCINVARVRKK